MTSKNSNKYVNFCVNSKKLLYLVHNENSEEEK